MKTKIIYISGDEVFDIADIRAAFEEVRSALKLDKNTVLFGVPVDADDAGLYNQPVVQPAVQPNETTIAEVASVATDDNVVDVANVISPEKETTTNEPVIISDEIVSDSPVEEKPTKKRGRSRKVSDDTEIEPVPTVDNVNSESADEKIVPILSILSGNDEVENGVQTPDIKESEDIIVNDETEVVEPEIIPDVPEFESEIITEKIESLADSLAPEEIEQISEKIEASDSDTEIEPDLEQLLSAMKPLQEDILESQHAQQPVPDVNSDSDENIDATLEQLATEFVQTQDKIASESKSSSRSKIGKLRNILPFKQSKHKDQGLGDLFGWAGVAANDEEFSVPGFFTNASSRK